MYITNIFGDLAHSQRFNFTSKSIHGKHYLSLCVLSDIAALTRELNNLSDRLNQLSEENEVLREQLGLDPRQQVDLHKVPGSIPGGNIFFPFFLVISIFCFALQAL